MTDDAKRKRERAERRRFGENVRAVLDEARQMMREAETLVSDPRSANEADIGSASSHDRSDDMGQYRPLRNAKGWVKLRV